MASELVSAAGIPVASELVSDAERLEKQHAAREAAWLTLIEKLARLLTNVAAPEAEALTAERVRPAKTDVGGRTQLAKLAAAAALFGVIVLMPGPPGLTPEGQRVLAIVAAAVLLWATEAVSVGVSSLLVVALLMVMGVVNNAADALVGFTSPAIFFLVGSLGMGSAVMRSGLAERLGAYLVERSKGSAGRMFSQLLLSMPFAATVIPSAINRNAMLIPAYQAVFRSLSIGKGHPLAKSIMLMLGLLSPFASSAYLTGGMAPITTSTLVGGFTWFRWFVLMAPPYYLLLALGGGLIYLLCGPSSLPLPPVEKRSEPRKPFSREEKVTLAVISGASVLWLSDFIHHWNPAAPALAASVVLMLPGLGVMTWSQFEKTVGWSIFFVVGASLSLTNALVSTGAADWMARGILGPLTALHLAPPLVAAFIVLVATIVHLAIPNTVACIALLIPVTSAFATANSVNPVAAALIVTISLEAAILYPVQTATNLISYETGHFDASDVLKLGLCTMALALVLIPLVIVPWWGLMGLQFVP